MAQFVVRDLEDDVRDKLRLLAAAHGRSMEEEVRDILRGAVLNGSASPEKLGSWCMSQFVNGSDDGEPHDFEELHGQPARPADFQ